MLIENEVVLSGNYALSPRYGLELAEKDAKTTTAYIVASLDALTLHIKAVQYPDNGDDVFYYSSLCDLEKFNNCTSEKLANFIFYYCPLWTGIKKQISEKDEKRIKNSIFEVLQAVEKLTK